MFTIGDFEIHLLNDALTMVDGGGAFGLVPRALWSRYLKPTDENLVPMNNLCLLVKAGGKNMLVDAAVGDKLNEKAIRWLHLTRPQGTLLDGLARLGVAPEDIDLVLNTHLHSDHCGWNTRYDDDGNIVPTFPNARHFVHRREYDDAMQPNERTRATYFPFNYQPLVENGQMELLDADAEVVPGIRMVNTPGHTPGHMSVVFESGGQYAMFMCDMSTYAVHFERLGWMTAYDVEPLITLETKRHWQQWAMETDALLFVVHDSHKPVARLRPDSEGKPIMQAVDCEYS